METAPSLLPAPLAWPLLPAGALYLGLARAKAALYGRGWLRRAVLPAPALSVGNLTFGGTGKTPFTLYLARRVQGMGCRPAILLRGYGRQTSAPRRVNPGDPAREVGEEALLYARGLEDLPVAVAARREEGALLVAPPPDLFLLDDAFQHLRVRRDADLLLVDASRPGDLRTPPLGRLREPLSAAARADLLVVTRGCYEDLPRPLRDRWGERPVLHARFRWAPELGPEGIGEGHEWRSRRLVAFAGVGNPAWFFAQARQEGFDLAETLAFPDHAEPTPDRMTRVARAALAGGAAGVLTTEKDAVKWLPLWEGPVPLLYPRLQTEVEDPAGHLAVLLDRLTGERR